jgi:hypothetical protein
VLIGRCSAADLRDYVVTDEADKRALLERSQAALAIRVVEEQIGTLDLVVPRFDEPQRPVIGNRRHSTNKSKVCN